MTEERVRRALLLRTALEILRDAGTKTSQKELQEELRRRIQLTPRELSLDNSGVPRYDRAIGFHIGDAATIGWASKIGGWSITEAGAEALDTYQSPEALWAERLRRLREVDRGRKEAQRNLSDVQQYIANIMRLVEPGTWTAQDDLAELAGTTPTEVAHFLASGKVKLPNAYRVLSVEGSVPAEGMLHVDYRGLDLRRRLAEEGIEFGADGHAHQDQRLTADALKKLLAARAIEDEEEAPASARRAWMVRGSNVDGFDLVPEWLREGFVSLSASQLRPVGPGVPYEQLRRRVDEGYEHKSYAFRGQRLEEFDRFLRRMRVGDLVLTTEHGGIHLGELTGPAYFTESEHGLSNLRRDVRWQELPEPVDGSRLRAPVPALLQSQAYVVDLTEAYQQLTDLIPAGLPPGPQVRVPALPQRQLAFHEITPEFAEQMLLDQGELATIADLLWENKQIVLYGPPGTGKTYLATKLASHLTDEGAVKLVQFHPSYTYEDFFEGFRPEPGGSGTLTFTLRPGPFRAFAEAAEANKTTPYIMIIDEVNRANLAKVFGELYFLLEYRDQQISLQYSPDKEFTLPENLFLIGTMNTADRSIARIDTAMRRRFQFVELHPKVPPVQGLLHRWLADRGCSDEAGLLLDELNRRIEDSDAAIGPSYLMKESIYQRPDGLERVWRYQIMPLLEDLFYGQPDLAGLFGLARLRQAITDAQEAT